MPTSRPCSRHGGCGRYQQRGERADTCRGTGARARGSAGTRHGDCDAAAVRHRGHLSAGDGHQRRHPAGAAGDRPRRGPTMGDRLQPVSTYAGPRCTPDDTGRESERRGTERYESRAGAGRRASVDRRFWRMGLLVAHPDDCDPCGRDRARWGLLDLRQSVARRYRADPDHCATAPTTCRSGSRRWRARHVAGGGHSRWSSGRRACHRGRRAVRHRRLRGYRPGGHR